MRGETALEEESVESIAGIGVEVAGPPGRQGGVVADKDDVQPGPQGRLRVPSAAISVLDIAMVGAGIPALGYFAQIPHYVSGEYAPAAVALLDAVAQHLDVVIEARMLRAEAEQL